MQRPIKFRVWDSTPTYETMTAIVELVDIENGFNVTGKHRHVMQYTGLKDKNGKEIYEGDVVKCFYPQEVKIMEVIFNQNTVSFEFRGEEVYDSLVNAGNFEVIGNIWENPELAKRK